MSGLRFKVGDLARLVVAPAPEENAQHAVGSIVEITQVGPFPIGTILTGRFGQTYKTWQAADYWIAYAEAEGDCRDWQLAPIDPPAEPMRLTRSTELQEPATA